MRKIHKVLIFCISLIGIEFSVCAFALLYPLPFIATRVKETFALYAGVNYLFAACSAFLGLCFLILLLVALFYPSDSNFLILARSKGKIQISKKTIESTVRYSFKNMEAVHSSRIKVKINKNPDKTKILIRLSLSDTSDIVTLTETIQNNAEASLQRSLGLAIKSISIRVVTSNQSNVVINESRVI